MAFRALTVCFAVGSIICTPALPASLDAAGDDPAQGTVWDLSPLYRDAGAWDKERADVEASLPALLRLKGGFGASAEALRTGLDELSAVRQRLNRLDEYASLRAAEDASIDASQERVQAISTLSARVLTRPRPLCNRKFWLSDATVWRASKTPIQGYPAIAVNSN
jgi:oligoendopeptidase F